MCFLLIVAKVYPTVFFSTTARCLDSEEWMNLMTDQFTIGRDENQDKFLEFSGRISKTLTGDIDCKAVPKKIRQYADPNHPRCIVKVFELYLSLVPEGRFYRRPLPNKGKEIYFSVQPVGLNSLKKYVQLMFRDAGIDWKAQNRNISNHSGKVTCCTRLYEKGFDEQSIAGRSGHRSDAIRVYKRPSHELLKEVSNALQPPRPQPIEPTVPITPPPKLHKEETETKPKENPVKEEKNVEEKNVLSMVVPAFLAGCPAYTGLTVLCTNVDFGDCSLTMITFYVTE